MATTTVFTSFSVFESTLISPPRGRLRFSRRVLTVRSANSVQASPSLKAWIFTAFLRTMM